MRARNPDRRGPTWAPDAGAFAAVIAAGALLCGVTPIALRSAGTWLRPSLVEAQAAGSAAPATAGKQESATAAKAGTSKPSAGKPSAGMPSAPSAGKPSEGSKSAAGPAVPAQKPAVRRTGGASVQSPVHLDEQVTYHYNALGRRDPFQSLMSGEYVGSDVGGDAPPDVGGIKVVGIVWGDTDQFALVEDARGDSHILRRGDKVMNGYVEGLKRDAMIVNLTLDGQSQSITVPLTRKGDKSNANR